MIDEFWFSVLSGAGLGAVYVAASWIMTRRLLKRPIRSALTGVFTGMLGRLAVVAILFLAILLLFPVDPLAMVGSFFACYLVGLVGEVIFVHKHPTASKPAHN